MSILSVALIVKMMLWVTDKSAVGAITQHFQAAEYILEHHQPPKAWTTPPKTLSQRLFQQDTKKPSPDYSDLLRRLDSLIVFFEHSTFFQDERSRTVLLEQLNNERESWISHLT